EHLVEIHDRPQAGGAGLLARPAQHLLQQQRQEEHALRVFQVGDIKDYLPRLLSVVQHAGQVERFTVDPGRKARRRQNVVQGAGQLEPVLLRVKRIDVERADLAQRRRLNLGDQLRQVEATTLAPGVQEQLGDQNMFPRLNRVGGNAGQAEQGRGGGVDLLVQR